MKNIITIFKREFRAYFDSPVAYVFLVAFLVLTGFLTFDVASFYERGQAELTPFFFWHPWVYLLLVPAATMGLWADERRNGTAELLLTLPITLTQALVGKFLAAWAFIGTGLALTFPILLTAGYLGDPDWGVAFCGYVGSFLLAGAATAIGVFASTISKSSVVGFVVSLALVFLLMIIGFDPVIGALSGWGVPAWLTDGIAACSLLTHFEALRRGVIDLTDVGYYVGVIVFMLVVAKTVTDGRRSAVRGAIALAILAVIVISADLILSVLFIRCDFTAERLYTLSDGSKAVLAKLDKTVTFKYYVSSVDGMPMEFKTYATRVGNLLKEYDRAAKGRLRIEQYDPKPSSDAEDAAQKYGISPMNAKGDPAYFGVVAVCGKLEETLPVLTPQTEATLEYDLTRLITRVAWPERPVVGVMTSLQGVLPESNNSMMMQMGQRPQQGWIAFSELAKDYDMRSVQTDVEKIDPAIKTLVLVHAKDLTDKTLYAIDQFVLNGGKLIACVDPFSLQDYQNARGGQNAMMQQMGGGDGPSTLGKLFDAWGVKFESGRIACDFAAALHGGDGRGNTRDDPTVLSLTKENMSQDDLLVKNLTQVLFPFAGALSFEKKDMDLAFSPVIATSEDKSFAIDKMALMYGGMENAKPDGHERVLAARLSGTFKTAYPKGPDGTNDVSKALSEGKSSVLVFADSDFLSDGACVQLIRSPFGTIQQLVSDNLVLFSNVIEQFAGMEELIGLRSRRGFNRPFTVVENLRAEALRKQQDRIREYQQQESEFNRKLNELRSQASANNRALLDRKARDEIRKVEQAAQDAKVQLRRVKKEMTAEIDSLGRKLKFTNVLLVPILVVLFGLLRGYLRKQRA